MFQGFLELFLELFRQHWLLMSPLAFLVLFVAINVLNDLWTGTGTLEPVPEPITPTRRQQGPRRTTYSDGQRQLRGRKFVLTMFVSTSKQRWDRSATKSIQSKIGEAERWIERQARSYGVKDLCFENGYLGDCSDGYTTWRYGCPRWEDSVEYNYSFCTDLLGDFGWDSFADFSDWAKHKYNCSQVIAICFVRKRGRCHCCYKSGVGIPLIVNYAWDNIGDPIMSSTIAHELMHAAGEAVDLYPRQGYPRIKSNRAQQLFPNSIMVHSRQSLSSATLDPVNAWRAGIGPWKPGYDWLCS